MARPLTGTFGETVTGRNASLPFIADLQEGHCDTLSPVQEKERLNSLHDIFFYR
jgi:hypothetical protein